MPKQNITEAEARMLHAKSVNEYGNMTHDECRALDSYIKHAALQRFEKYIVETVKDAALRKWINLMARCHFRSIETDDLLQSCDCYPAWLREH